jgi:hypothetical protein
MGGIIISWVTAHQFSDTWKLILGVYTVKLRIANTNTKVRFSRILTYVD